MGNLSGLDDPSSSAIILESSASGEGSVNVNSNKPFSEHRSHQSLFAKRIYLIYLKGKNWDVFIEKNGQSKTRGSFFGEISHPTKKFPSRKITQKSRIPGIYISQLFGEFGSNPIICIKTVSEITVARLKKTISGTKKTLNRDTRDIPIYQNYFSGHRFY